MTDTKKPLTLTSAAVGVLNEILAYTLFVTRHGHLSAYQLDRIAQYLADGEKSVNVTTITEAWKATR